MNKTEVCAFRNTGPSDSHRWAPRGGDRVMMVCLVALLGACGGGSGDGVGVAAWPAYRVSNSQMWTMQKRLNDCYRQQRFPEPKFGSDATIALSVYMGVNSKGSESIVPAIKR